MSNARHVEVLNVMYGILDGLAQGLGVYRGSAQGLLPAAKQAVAAANAALQTGETFDPQAVRELLLALETTSQPRDQHVIRAINRVRESEKK